ncbi:MAG: F0F1 ATP synthase subunit B [Rhodospirillaceae bacterium]|nr:F0F1 ATP synthase subunit B [Rhodospirillaceae bacterium]
MDHLFSAPEFWVAVAFVLFFVLAGRQIWRFVAKALDARTERIHREIEEAQRLRQEAEALLAEYHKKQSDAQREAEAIVTHARGEAERLRRDAEESIRQTLERRERQALDKIAQAEAQAVADVRNEAVDVAVAAARRLLAGSMDETRSRAITDKAIAEVERGLQ